MLLFLNKMGIIGICPQIIDESKGPCLLCFYKSEEQKNYCTKLIDELKFHRKFEPEMKQSDRMIIQLIIDGNITIVKNDPDLSDRSIFEVITKINNIFIQRYGGSFFPESCKEQNIETNLQKNPKKITIFENNEIQDLEKSKKEALKRQKDKRNEKLEKSRQKIVKKQKDNRNEKLEIMKKKILKRQKYNRYVKVENPNEKEKNEKLNKELEDMCNLGNIMKNQIKIEKIRNPEKFIEINEALNLEKKDQGLFALGLLGNILEQNGTDVIIEKEENYKNELDAGTTVLQFISNGLAQKTKYDLHFDFGEQRNEELLKDKNEYNKFKEELIEKLSKDYNIPKNKIIVTFPQKGSFSVQVIFQSDEFNKLDTKEFINKFKNDDDFPELKKFKRSSYRCNNGRM